MEIINEIINYGSTISVPNVYWTGVTMFTGSIILIVLSYTVNRKSNKDNKDNHTNNTHDDKMIEDLKKVQRDLIKIRTTLEGLLLLVGTVSKKSEELDNDLTLNDSKIEKLYETVNKFSTETSEKFQKTQHNFKIINSKMEETEKEHKTILETLDKMEGAIFLPDEDDN